MRIRRPHVLGIDDAPFVKRPGAAVPLVAVLTEGAALVEGVAVGAFPVDGPDATAHLAAWIDAMRWRASVQAVVLGGITLAGLGVVDLAGLSGHLGLPVLAVTRRDTATSALAAALTAAGLTDRLALVARTPPSVRVDDRLWVAAAGLPPDEAAALVRAVRHKSLMPEPLRLAHLIGAALVRGQSRGRV